MKVNSYSKILVIGDVMLDHYVHGICNRISPEAPVPIVSLNHEQWLLGGAANVANNLIHLDLNVILCGVVGNDENAVIIEKILKDKKIRSALIYSRDRKTTVKTRILSDGQQLLRVDREDIFFISESEEKIIIKKINSLLGQCDYILISDYNKGFLTKNFLEQIMLLAEHFKIPVIVDPKSPPFIKYSGAQIIKPNKKEAFLESGIELVDKFSIEKACKIISQNTGIPIVIITLSEDGVALYYNGSFEILPTRALEICDVTGAGDTFLAALTYKLINSKNIKDACEFANYAAGIVVAKNGAATTSVNEIEKLIINFKSKNLI
jgi:rfaE bifunctional protein kinase chain/domain